MQNEDKSADNTGILNSLVDGVYSFGAKFSIFFYDRFARIAKLSGWTPLGMAPAMLGSSNGALEVINQAAKLAEQHPSGMSCFSLAGVNHIAVIEKDALKQIFYTDNAKLVRAENSLITEFAGNSMFFMQSGNEWNQRRKIWKHHLVDSASLQSYHPEMKECLKNNKRLNLLLEQEQGESVDLQDFITEIVMSIAQKSLLKGRVDLQKVSQSWKSFTDEAHWLIGTARGQLTAYMQSSLKLLNMKSTYANFLNFKQDLQQKVSKEYDGQVKQEESGDGKTILDDLGKFSKENASPSALLDEIGFIIEALHENTIKTFCFIVKLLNKHPDVEEKLRKELNEKLSDDIDSWTYEQIKDLKYLDNIFNEMLRLYTTAPVYLRTVKEPFKLGHVQTQQGDIILVPSLYIHHMEKHWGKDAEMFKPERFDSQDKREPYSFIPFGEGNRACVGRYFATHELKLILAFIYRKHRLVVQGENNFDVTWKILLSFNKPTIIKVQAAEISKINIILPHKVIQQSS